MFPLNPVVLKLIGVAALFLGGIYAGVRIESDHRDAQLLVQERAYQEVYHSKVVFSNEIAKQLEVQRGKRKIVFRTIERQVQTVLERPVYHIVCFDPDGVRLTNEAAAGRSGAGERAREVPGGAAGAN